MKFANRGITLIELLITISIAVLLTTIVIPSMQGLIADARVASSIGTLSSMMTFARSKAIELNQDITICPTIKRVQCDEAYDWNQGVMVFADLDNNKKRDASEPLLKYHPMNEQLLIFSGTTPGKSGRSRKRAVFSPSGSASGYTVSVRFCARNESTKSKVLILQNSGRIRISDRDGSGKRPDCRT
jgi:type IV fimbrial biogenesis protein FimT